MPLGIQDLKTFLEDKCAQSMTEEHLLILLYNMLCAVNSIHKLNIIHRDLKPANMLLNELCEVTICDFGLARVNPCQTDL